MKKKHLLDEIFGIVIFAFVLLIFASLISYDKKDLPFLTSNPNIPAKNLVRGFGAYLAFGLFFIMGWASYLLVFILGIFGLKKIRHKETAFNPNKIIATGVLIFSLSSLFSLIFLYNPQLSFEAGGRVGALFSGFVNTYFGKVGGYVILITFMLLSSLLLGEFLLYPFLTKALVKFKNVILLLADNVVNSLRQIKKITMARNSYQVRPVRKFGREGTFSNRLKPKQALKNTKSAPAKDKEMASGEPMPPQAEPRLSIFSQKKEKPKKEISVSKSLNGDYRLPSLDLLDEPKEDSTRKDIKEDLTQNARILEDTLADFGISARVTDIERGPTITRYELEPASGVKVQRIVSLSDDIALAMKAQSVRIVAPIPGKGRVGIEVPNIQIGSVYFKEVIQSGEFIKAKSKLTLALGKDIAGKPVVADLGEMPHLLIAGATGSGKTVCVNCLVMSLLFRLTPDEVKLLMVDPKMVELAGFNGLPHLLTPVVTEPKKVSGALNWVVQEMEERYKLLAREGVRNIETYNLREEKIPYIVVIIDELADLMAIAQHQIENAITRLAQLSRAVGIHLILATQRPSVDVITGVIKANFPARISFKVASKVDSRTVLDANGADKLLGKGDMLFLRPGQTKLIRIQGGYLKDTEIERVVKFIKSQGQAVYREEILKTEEKLPGYLDTEKDELFDDAVRVILESNQASVSILQRRMRLGYTRAARLIDAMEQEGIVGPYQGSKPRKILVDREEYLKQRNNA